MWLRFIQVIYMLMLLVRNICFIFSKYSEIWNRGWVIKASSLESEGPEFSIPRDLRWWKLPFNCLLRSCFASMARLSLIIDNSSSKVDHSLPRINILLIYIGYFLNIPELFSWRPNFLFTFKKFEMRKYCK